MSNKRKFNEKRDPFSILMKKLNDGSGNEIETDKVVKNTINKNTSVFVPKEVKVYPISGQKMSSGESPNSISNKMKLTKIN